MIAYWTYPTQVAVGAGAAATLADACRALGLRSLLVVIDPHVERLPPWAAVRAVLAHEAVELDCFSAFSGNPTVEQALQGADHLRGARHHGVLAVGGGSAIDIAKAIALAASGPQHLEQSEWSCAMARPPGPLQFPILPVLPILAVPTTAGTGSELGSDAVLVQGARKRVFTHPQMLPAYVALDPVMTVGLPPALTAATGMDALTHHLEAYFSPVVHPMSDGVAIEGMRLVRDHLLAAVHDGADLAARAGMLQAAAMGAVAFQKGLGGVHALAHALGARYGLHHGLLNAVLLPYVLAANAPAIAPKARRIARCLDLADESLAGLMDWILLLRRELAIAHDLRALGLEPGELDELARAAFADRSSLDTNPVPWDAAQCAAVLRHAFDGDLSC